MPSKSALSVLRAIRDQVTAQKPKVAQPIVQAPEIIIPGKIQNVREAMRRQGGAYGAKRVERAADEVKNLEQLFTEKGLMEAFGGDNAKALMTMNPADFERYAKPLQRTDSIGPKMAGLAKQGEIDKSTTTTDDYIKYLLQLQGGFDDVPFLGIKKKEQGLPLFPSIDAHEGRHRSRAMADRGETSSLVRLLPRGEMREPFPRRSQEEFIEALKKELEMTDNMVMPEKIYIPDPDSPYDKAITRPALKLPDVYAAGGVVKGALAAAKKAVGKVRGDEPTPRPSITPEQMQEEMRRQALANVPEQKMLQGVYRGFAGENVPAKTAFGNDTFFTTPQKRVADYYARRRAAETGLEPHAEMMLVDPFELRNNAYGLGIPIDKHNRDFLTTRARRVDPDEVKSRTPLYAEGGSVATFKDGGAATGFFPQMQPRRAANSGAGERMTEEALKFFIPQDTTDLALMAFPFGKAGKAAAAGLLALTPADAEAGKLKTGVDLARRSFFGLKPSQDMAGRELAPLQKDLDRMQAELAKAPKVEQKTTTVQPSPTAPKIEQTVKSIAETPMSRRTVLKSAAGQAIQGALPASSFADLMKPATVIKQAVQAAAPAAAVTAASVPALMAKAVKMGMDSDEALAFVKRELGESAETVMAKQDPELLYDTLKDPFESIVDDPEWLYKFKNGKQDRLMGPGELLQVQLGQGDTPGPLKETLRGLKAEMSPEDYANMKNAMRDAINQEIKYGGDY